MVEKLNVETVITQIRNSIQGELTSRGQVVDLLLDLRLAGSDHGAAVEAIDRALAEIPGQTTVPNSWWLAALSDIERSTRPVPTASTAAAPNAAAPAGPTAPDRARAVSSPPPLPRRRPPR